MKRFAPSESPGAPLLTPIAMQPDNLPKETLEHSDKPKEQKPNRLL